MEASERHLRRNPVPRLLVLGWWVSVLLHLCRALNCALPQPLLVGIQNATAVQLPVDVELTTTSASAGASSDLIFVATHNARDILWNQKITIDTPGRHRVLAIVASPISACSRTDFFVFDGYLSPESNANTEEPPALGCQLTPELHLLIFWSAMPDDDFSRLLRAMTALSDITSYPETDYHVRLRGIFRADLGVGHRINENWYREFYGKTYYGLYFGTPDRVDMVYVKGDGDFHVVLVEDLCPKYAYDLKREMVLNTNMFALKNLLREQSSQWYQVHTTQTRQESDADYKFLFGETGREIFHSLRLDHHLWPAVTYEGLRIDDGIYIIPWRRVFIAIDAMEVLGAMMQSEWYRFELDVPEIHAELTPGMLDPDPTSSQENIHRAAFLGSSRLPLLAHLPTDSLWYKGRLELKRVKEFRVLKENTWGQRLPPCCTVGDAAAILSSQDVAVLPEEGSLRDHVRQLQHRVEHFNHTVIVVGASIDGPFTIWDGNHRAIALALTQPDSHLLLVYVGVSSKFTSPHLGSLFCP